MNYKHLDIIHYHWRRRVKILRTPTNWKKKVAITDEIIGVSPLIGVGAWTAPSKSSPLCALY